MRARWLLLLLCMLACRREKADAPRRIVIATSQEPDILLPAFAETAAANQVIEAGYRSLTHYNRDWQLIPALSTRIPTLENGGVVLEGQGMRVTWTLRPDAKWADGTPLTSSDFVFAHEVMTDLKQEVRDRTIVDKIARMEAPDPTTLVVHWKEVDAFYAGFRNHPVFPRHVMEPQWRVDGGTLPLKGSVLGKRPLFFGPFQFAEWKPGEFIRLSRNPHAYAPPVVDDVIWQFIPRDVAAIAALEAGSVDAIAPDGTVGVDLVEDLVARRPGAFRADFHPGMTWAHVDVNTEHPLLRDKRMRQALLMALDREQAIKSIFRGRYDVSHSLFPPRHDGHHAALKTWPFDAAKANALLDELGFKRGENGMRVTTDGAPLRLEIAYASGIKTTEDLMLVFQANLRAVGIELVLQGAPHKTLMGDIIRRRKAPHLAFYAWTMDPQAYAETLLASSKIPSEANNWEGQNYVGYRNADVDALIQRIPRELDGAARAKLLRRLNDIFVEELPMLPVYTRPVVSVTRAGFKNWAPTGTQTSVSWNAETWSPQ